MRKTGNFQEVLAERKKSKKLTQTLFLLRGERDRRFSKQLSGHSASCNKKMREKIHGEKTHEERREAHLTSVQLVGITHFTNHSEFWFSFFSSLLHFLLLLLLLTPSSAPSSILWVRLQFRLSSSGCIYSTWSNHQSDLLRGMRCDGCVSLATFQCQVCSPDYDQMSNTKRRGHDHTTRKGQKERSRVGVWCSGLFTPTFSQVTLRKLT